MPFRLLHIHASKESAPAVGSILEHHEPAWWRPHESGAETPDFTALVEVGKEQKLLDALGGALVPKAGDRLVILPIETTIPQIEEQPAPVPEPGDAEGRVSREELYDDLSEASKLTKNFLTMVVLAAGVVTIGLVRDSAAVVIGGMVLAPLLGPNIALAFAATVGDGKLASRALHTSLTGLSIALAMGILVGLFGGLECAVDGVIARAEILSRTQPHVLDLLLASAAGIAGALSFTSALSMSLVGVMVAVALMPPLVVFGMCLGAGRFVDAGGACVLLLTNIVCVILAAVLTFLARAIRPRDWWDVQRSRRVVRAVILGLLVVLAGISVILVLGPYGGGR